MRFLLSLFVSVCLFACAHAETQKTIDIFTYKVQGAKPWDPTSAVSGISGSEEAIIYISDQLVKLGYKVNVIGDPPPGSIYSLPEANPRYIPFDADDHKPIDIAIAWRQPGIGPMLKQRAKQVYLWPHDTYDGYLTDEQITSFDDVLWLSQWQKEYWTQRNAGFRKFTHIFGNGLVPEQFHKIEERKNPYSCIYSSNYARGLEILLDIWPVVRHFYPQATLDIYYGWNHWGLLSPLKEEKMRLQVAALSAAGVTDHGCVGHQELAKAFEHSSFWTYPCIVPETFCITGIRAQLAGAIPVIIQGTALRETVRHGYACTNVDEYLKTLLNALSKAKKVTVQDREKMGEFVLKEYTWEEIAKQWKKVFDAVSENSSQTACVQAKPR